MDLKVITSLLAVEHIDSALIFLLQHVFTNTCINKDINSKPFTYTLGEGMGGMVSPAGQ